jgi:hypothetical protein
MLTVVMDAPNMYTQSSALLDKGFSTPVAAEQAGDRLPAVPKDLRRALHSTPTTAAPASTTGSGESAAALLPHGHGHGGGPLAALGSFFSSGPVLVVEGLLLLVALLRLRLRIRRRRRHRRYAHYQNGRPAGERPQETADSDSIDTAEDERVLTA